MKSRTRHTLLTALAFAGLAMAQNPAAAPGGENAPQPPPGPMNPGGPRGLRMGPGPVGPGGPGGPMQPGRPPMERAMGRWWMNPAMVEKLGVTVDQKKKMEDIFQQHRLKLIDLTASLQKAEAILEPLVNADTPDESKILAQIDRVAQARAELEKANARMLLAVRQTLTPEQWKKLQEERNRPGPGPAGGPRAPQVPQAGAAAPRNSPR